jgi:hypothetical protein
MRMQQSHQSEQNMFQQQSKPPQKGKDKKWTRRLLTSFFHT